jgi:hypothetical protein
MPTATVNGMATYHNTGNSGVDTTVNAPPSFGVLLKSWLPSMLATVVVGRKATVMAARIFIELEYWIMITESDDVNRLKDSVIELLMRSCVLPRRSLVERKSDCL